MAIDLETTPAPPSRLSRGLRVVGRFLKGWLCLLLVVVAGGLALLTTVGLPPPLLRVLERQLETRGFHAEIRRVRLSPMEGLLLKDVRFYGDPPHTVALLTVRRCAVFFNPLDYLAHRPGLWSLRLQGVTVEVPLGRAEEWGQAARSLTLEQLSMAASFRSDGFHVEDFHARVGSADVEARGRIYRRFPLPAGAEPLESLPLALRNRLQQLPAWVRRTLEQVRMIQCASPPKVSVDFDVAVDDPGRTRLTLKASGAKTTTPGGVFDRWEMSGGLAKGNVVLQALTLRQGAHRLNLSLQMDLQGREAEFRLYNDLPLRRWLPLLPAAWRARITQPGVEWDGQALMEVWGGPAPRAELNRHLTGYVSLDQAVLGGVWWEKAYLAFQRRDNLISIDRLDGVVGQGVAQGPLKVRGSYDTETRRYQFWVESGFDPNLFKPLFTSNQLAIAKWFEFDRGPPAANVEIAGQVGDRAQYRLEGDLAATNFLYRGVRVGRCETPIHLRNGVLRLAPMRVVREEGEANGWLDVDYNRQLVAFEVDSALQPHDFARMIGPATARTLEPYRFEGSTHITASGQVGYASFTCTEVEGFVEGEKMGWAWALADQASFRVSAKGRQVALLDVDAHLYGGTLAGDLWLDFNDRQGRMRYRSTGRFQDLQFADLVCAWTKVEGTPYHGRLSGEYEVVGLAGEGRGKTAVGQGHLHIAEGQLFAIPLMGGLSQRLSKIYPGLGFAAQTDFDAPFTIEDGRFHTEEARLEGSVLSLLGRGDYFFDTRLDMDVQVQLLRKGQVVDVLRLATVPLTKLLEFHLFGTIKDPRWHPVNLPKELLLIFD